MLNFNTYNTTNIPFKASITDKEIDGFKDAKQHFSDCYIMTTLETLSHTENGREILKEQIHHDDNIPNQINCYFYKKMVKKNYFLFQQKLLSKNMKKFMNTNPTK